MLAADQKELFCPIKVLFSTFVRLLLLSSKFFAFLMSLWSEITKMKRLSSEVLILSELIYSKHRSCAQLT